MRYECASFSSDTLSEYCTTLPTVSIYSEKDLLESAWSWVRSSLFAEGYRNRGEKENSSSSFLTDISTCSLGFALRSFSSATTVTIDAAADVYHSSLSGEGTFNRERGSSLRVATAESVPAPATVTAGGLLLSWIQQHDTTHPNFKVDTFLTPRNTTLCHPSY